MKYVFLNAHNWADMEAYDQFFSNIDEFDNVDFSLTHQYGTILYGLAKIYKKTGLYGGLLKRIWNYYYNMFTATGNGSYLQSFPFAIKATILLYEKTGNETYRAVAEWFGEQLLARQQLNESAMNYGGFREWGGAEYVYLDFEAPAGGALKALYQLTGDEKYRVALERFVNSLFIDPDGGICCYRDPEGTQIDSDIPTYKAALLLVSSTLGVNDTITLYAMSHVWNRTTYTDEKIWINVTYSGLPWGQEPSAESMGWGLSGWLEYARHSHDLFAGRYVVYSDPLISRVSYGGEKLYITVGSGGRPAGSIFVYCLSEPRNVYLDGEVYGDWSYDEDTHIIEIYSDDWSSTSTLMLDWSPGGYIILPTVFLTVRAEIPMLQPGETATATLHVAWKGVNDLVITSVEFKGDAAAGWISLAEELPKNFTKNPAEEEGRATLKIRVSVPVDAELGNYTELAVVTATSSALTGEVTQSGHVTFQVAAPRRAPVLPLPELPEPVKRAIEAWRNVVPDYMTFFFAIFLLLLIITGYLKRR